MRCALFTLACLALTSAAAAPAWQWEAGIGREGMDGLRPPWTQADLALRGPLNADHTLEATARRTERFEQQDAEFGLRLGRRFSPQWNAALALSASPTHRLLAAWTVSAEAQRLWAEGWVSSGSLRVARHDAVTATTLGLTQERYFSSPTFGEWRAAAHVSGTRLSGSGAGPGAGSGHGLRLQLDRQFGDHLRVGLLVASGREWEPVGAGAWTVMRVRSQALTGHWQLGSPGQAGAGWALLAAWSNTEVRGVYRRSGGRLGVQRDL